jgi:proline iminopeptidase
VWSTWEIAVSKIHTPPEQVKAVVTDDFALKFARIECHYFINGGFLHDPNQLLDGVPKIRHIPAVIVQGRYDIVCPMKSAWDLHCAWPEAELRVVPDAGHSAFEPGILAELVAATDRYADR